MKNKKIPQKFAILIFIFVSVSMAACSNVAAEVSYKPPVIPLRVSVNTWGEISISADTADFPTPLGTASIGVVVDPTRQYGVQNTLTVRLNRKDYFYDLHGKDFQIDFESGYYEQITLRKKDKDIFLELTRSEISKESSIPSAEGSSNTLPEKQAAAPQATSKSGGTTQKGNNSLCPGSLQSKLSIGDQAEVMIFQLSGRSNPGFGSNKEHVLAKGRRVEIIDGPECADQATWWKIYFSGEVSSGNYLEYSVWMPEVDYDTYYLAKVR